MDVVLPVRSYFQNVPHSIESVTTDQSIAAFLQLEPTFGGIGTSDVYNPWDRVDLFGRARIFEQLDPAGTCRLDQNLELTSKVSTVHQ